MNIGEICSRKVSVIKKDASLLQAGKQMRGDHVGSLVVVEEKEGGNFPIGMITDRDILTQVLSEGVPLEKISVEDIMKTQVVTAREQDEVYETIQKMQIRGVRRIPIVNTKGFLSGILALDDVLGILAEELKKLADVVFMERKKESRGQL